MLCTISSSIDGELCLNVGCAIFLLLEHKICGGLFMIIAESRACFPAYGNSWQEQGRNDSYRHEIDT